MAKFIIQKLEGEMNMERTAENRIYEYSPLVDAIAEDGTVVKIRSPKQKLTINDLNKKLASIPQRRELLNKEENLLNVLLAELVKLQEAEKEK